MESGALFHLWHCDTAGRWLDGDLVAPDIAPDMAPVSARGREGLAVLGHPGHGDGCVSGRWSYLTLLRVPC